MLELFQNKIIPKMVSISRLKYLQVLVASFMLSFPVTIVGSIAVVLINIPFMPDWYVNTMTAVLGNTNNATMGIMALFVSFGIGYYMAKNSGVDDEAQFVGVASLAAFLVVTPTTLITEGGETVSGIFQISNLGASGMFVGMIISFVAAELYCFVKRKGWKITMPDAVPETVSKSFSALIPMVFSVLSVVLINFIIVTVFGNDMHSLIFGWIQAPLMGVIGGSFISFLLIQFSIQFLWFFGIHGHNVVNPIIQPITAALGLENLEAFTSGAPRVHIYTQQFQDVFTVGIGGSGMTLTVVLLMIFIMKSKTLKSLGKLAIGPGLFNVNEPIIFGLPIVLNPLAFIPWVFGTIIAGSIAYFAMKLGIVPLTTGVAIPWTTPIFISGMMATNSIAGGILQLVQAAVIAVIWFPFLKMMDKQYLVADNEDDEDFSEFADLNFNDDELEG